MAAAILITLTVLWVKQNLVFLSELESRGLNADLSSAAGAKATAKKAMGLYKAVMETIGPWRPLRMPSGFQDIGDTFFASASPLVAGLILLVSLFFSGLRIQVCFLLAATIAFAGHLIPLPMETVGPLNRYHLSMIAGTILSIVGIVFLRKNNE